MKFAVLDFLILTDAIWLMGSTSHALDVVKYHDISHA